MVITYAVWLPFVFPLISVSAEHKGSTSPEFAHIALDLDLSLDLMLCRLEVGFLILPVPHVCGWTIPPSAPGT
jgi:hypothetical protein